MLAFIGCDDLRTFQVRIIAICFVGHGESGEIPLFQARCSLRQHLIGDMYVQRGWFQDNATRLCKS
jgi:hypothetical protein